MAIFLLLLAGVVVYTVFIFNRLIRLQNMVKEAWSGIDVQLKKRYDLVPLLVKAVAGFAGHEKALFETVTMLRSKGIEAASVKDQEVAEIGLSKALGQLYIVAENYPALTSGENFLELQKEISQVEHDLQRARRYYNGSVRNYNILIEQFPSSLVARFTRHHRRDFFDLNNETERNIPDINFNPKEL